MYNNANCKKKFSALLKENFEMYSQPVNLFLTGRTQNGQSNDYCIGHNIICCIINE
jgi:hypothetical protein